MEEQHKIDKLITYEDDVSQLPMIAATASHEQLPFSASSVKPICRQGTTIAPVSPFNSKNTDVLKQFLAKRDRITQDIQQEIIRLEQDDELLSSSYFLTFLLILVTQEIATESDIMKNRDETNIIKRKSLRSLNQLHKSKTQILLPLQQDRIVDELTKGSLSKCKAVKHPVSMDRLREDGQVRAQLTVLLKYLVLNQFSALIGVTLVLLPPQPIMDTLLDHSICQQKYTFFVELAYKGVFKRDHRVFDKAALINYQFSFASALPHSLSTLQLRSQLVYFLINQKAQFLLIRFLQYLPTALYIGEEHLLLALRKRQYFFVREFCNTDEILPIIKKEQVFQEILLNRDDDMLLIHQIPILRAYHLRFRLQFSFCQLTQIHYKYSCLLSDPSRLARVHPHKAYVLCTISLLLFQLRKAKSRLATRFLDLSVEYRVEAEKIINSVAERRTLLLMLFQKHHLQECRLINVLFQEQEHFQSILNSPFIYRWLFRVWQGERNYSSNFIRQTQYWQLFRRGARLLLDNKSYQRTYANDIKDTNAEVDTLLVAESLTLAKVEALPTAPSNNLPIFPSPPSPPYSNIFSLLHIDENDSNLKMHFIYQYDIFLINSQFRRILKLIVLFVLFVTFLNNIKTNFAQLNMSIAQWDPDLITLMQWIIPTAHVGQVEVLLDQAQAYKDYVMTIPDEMTLKIIANKNSDFYCLRRLDTYVWHNLTLKNKYYEFCTSMTAFDFYINMGALSTFNFRCLVNMSICLHSLLGMIYYYLNHGVVRVQAAHFYDIFLFGLFSLLIYYNQLMANNIFYNEIYMNYYRALQFISFGVISTMYLRFINEIKIFKFIGFYIMVIAQILYNTLTLMSFMFSMMVMIALAYHFLFASIDESFLNEDQAIMNILVIPLGNFGYSYFIATKQLGELTLLRHLVDYATTYMLMILMLNLLIALLTNQYEETKTQTERKFSHLLFEDYLQCLPNKYYSCLQNCPSYFSFLVLPLVPLLVCLRLPQLNNALNLVFYVLTMLIPFLLLYYIVNLILSPLLYLRTLYCICRRRFSDVTYRPVRKTIRETIVYFLQFMILGWFYLLYCSIVRDTRYIIRRLFQRIPSEHHVLFNRELYYVFKKTVLRLARQETGTILSAQFNQALEETSLQYLATSRSTLNRKMAQLQSRLAQQPTVDVDYYRHMLVLLKNSRQEAKYDRHHYEREKLRHIQILFQE